MKKNRKFIYAIIILAFLLILELFVMYTSTGRHIARLGLDEYHNMFTTIYTPVLVFYNGTNQTLNVPDYKELREGDAYPHSCTRYTRKAAKDLFDKDYIRADAWNQRYQNKLVISVENHTLDELADKGVLKPGMVVGLYNPHSQYKEGVDEKGYPKLYTHVALFLGMTQEGELLFADQYGNRTFIRTEEELISNDLIPVEIIDAKD